MDSKCTPKQARYCSILHDYLHDYLKVDYVFSPSFTSWRLELNKTLKMIGKKNFIPNSSSPEPSNFWYTFVSGSNIKILNVCFTRHAFMLRTCFDLTQNRPDITNIYRFFPHDNFTTFFRDFWILFCQCLFTFIYWIDYELGHGKVPKYFFLL